MNTLQHLFNKNKQWANDHTKEDPQFFNRLAREQHPEYLWIGCSDSRISPNQVLNLSPGEVFVHRNIANQVDNSDANYLSVLQYAVDALKIKHVLVCGHYGCGGIKAAVDHAASGVIGNWLKPVEAIQAKHQSLIDEVLLKHSDVNKYNLMCELNVVEQTINIAKSEIIQNAWQRNQAVSIHALLYSLDDGLLKSLGTEITSKHEIDHFTEISKKEIKR